MVELSARLNRTGLNRCREGDGLQPRQRIRGDGRHGERARAFAVVHRLGQGVAVGELIVRFSSSSLKVAVSPGEAIISLTNIFTGEADG